MAAAIYNSPGLAFDLDTPADIEELERRSPGTIETLVQEEDDMSEQKLKLGVLLPTRGLLMTGDRPKDASSIIALAERAEGGGT